MKVRSNKETQREKMQREMQRYLAGGGRVRRVPDGASGVDVAGGPQRPPYTIKPKATRTDLSALAAAIDARKRRAHPAAGRAGGRLRRRPRRKLLYDDFGEPLRWVWDDASDP